MKKTWIIGFTLLIGLMISGCNKAEANDSPTSVVKQCYDALAKGDEKTFHDLWDDFKTSSVLFEVMSKRDTVQILKTAKFEEIINGDEAIVKVTFKYDKSSYREDMSLTDDVDLVKINGKWKIHYIK